MILNVEAAAPETQCGERFEDTQCVLPAFVSLYNGDEMIAPAAFCRVHLDGHLAELVGADLHPAGAA